jgi:hypothetical protein
VVALGLSPEPILADFQRFFPEDGTPDAAVFVPDEPMPQPRLELATRAEDLSPAVRRAGAAGVELLLVLALGAGVAWLFGAGFWSTSAWTALAYYPVATALTGRTLGRPQVRRVAWARWLRRPSAVGGGASFDEVRTELPLRELAAEAEPSDSTDEFRPPQTAVH